jgi:hypothetical protein
VSVGAPSENTAKRALITTACAWLDSEDAETQRLPTEWWRAKGQPVVDQWLVRRKHVTLGRSATKPFWHHRNAEDLRHDQGPVRLEATIGPCERALSAPAARMDGPEQRSWTLTQTRVLEHVET